MKRFIAVAMLALSSLAFAADTEPKANEPAPTTDTAKADDKAPKADAKAPKTHRKAAKVKAKTE